jgi:UDP-3-O-[3-hydroxymyristoyl] glucosamine N-acyltransferase
MKFCIDDIIKIIPDISKIMPGDITGTTDPVPELKGLSSFDDAGPQDLTFACDSLYLSRMGQTRAKAVLVPESFSPEPGVSLNCILLKTANPKLSFFKILGSFYPEKILVPNIHSAAIIGKNSIFGLGTRIEANVVIGDDVTLGDNVHIMANVTIADGCIIGDHTVIKPNVTLMEGSDLGHHVIVHPGSVVGSDGYGFAQNGEGHEKLTHTGHVKIGNHVEIGACNTIDKGTLGVTVLGNGVKTDNLVHIAHNVKIGDNTLVVAQVGIAGSTRIGKNVIIAGKAGISGHLTIGDSAIIGPYAGVSKDVPENQIVSGIPHMPHKIWLKVSNIIPRLPEMRKKLFSFEKRLKDLENKS